MAGVIVHFILGYNMKNEAKSSFAVINILRKGTSVNRDCALSILRISVRIILFNQMLMKKDLNILSR